MSDDMADILARAKAEQEAEVAFLQRLVDDPASASADEVRALAIQVLSHSVGGWSFRSLVMEVSFRKLAEMKCRVGGVYSKTAAHSEALKAAADKDLAFNRRVVYDHLQQFGRLSREGAPDEDCCVPLEKALDAMRADSEMNKSMWDACIAAGYELNTVSNEVASVVDWLGALLDKDSEVVKLFEEQLKQRPWYCM